MLMLIAIYIHKLNHKRQCSAQNCAETRGLGDTSSPMGDWEADSVIGGWGEAPMLKLLKKQTGNKSFQSGRTFVVSAEGAGILKKRVAGDVTQWSQGVRDKAPPDVETHKHITQ